jgi:hypothetical protein
MDFSVVFLADNSLNSFGIKEIIPSAKLLEGLVGENVEVVNSLNSQRNNEKEREGSTESVIGSFSFVNASSVFRKDFDISVNVVPQYSSYSQLETFVFHDVERGHQQPQNSFFDHNIVKTTFALSPDWQQQQQEANEYRKIVV